MKNVFRKEKHLQTFVLIASKVIPLALAILFFMLGAGVGQAYTLWGPKWPNANPRYVFDNSFNSQNVGWNNTGEAAVNDWNNIGGTPFRFDPAGEGNNHITVDPQGVCSKLAVTYIVATPTTMSQFTTKVHIGCGFGFYDGTQPYFPSNYYDLETLMRHEFGHGLGLCHTNVGILMQASQPTGLTRVMTRMPNKGTGFFIKQTIVVRRRKERVFTDEQNISTDSK